MDFILATGNAHKAEEFSKLFDPTVLLIKAAPEKIDVIEDGTSYFENALLKARAYYEKYKTPVLADDSGLTVLALPGELDIHSARFGGEVLDDKGRALLLIERLRGQAHREAYFSCVLCFYLNPSEIYYFEGRMKGEIGHEYIGSTGFGYDPVFIPYTGQDIRKTVAEMPEWKNDNSHRALASRGAQKFFNQRNT